MKTIEEKAHEYAKEISLSYGVFGSSTLICDAIKKVAERAYIKCYEDIMAIPLSERITEEEKEKIRKELESYYNACNALLKAFCEKHEFDYEDAKDSWVANDVGGISCCNDYYFNMDVIVTDLRENADEGELLDWYDYVMRCSNLGVSSVNFRSWLKRCPVISENDLRIMEEAKQRVDHATRDFKELIKKLRNKETMKS